MIISKSVPKDKIRDTTDIISLIVDNIPPRGSILLAGSLGGKHSPFLLTVS